jgi:hypothetical protein
VTVAPARPIAALFFDAMCIGTLYIPDKRHHGAAAA